MIVFLLLLLMSGCSNKDETKVLTFADLHAPSDFSFNTSVPVQIQLHSIDNTKNVFARSPFRLFLDIAHTKSICLSSTDNNGDYLNTMMLPQGQDKIFMTYPGGSKELLISNNAIEASFNPTSTAKDDADGDGADDSWDYDPNDPDYAFIYYYPYNASEGTLMFEDLWPDNGDYDMNDLVMNYNVQMIFNQEQTNVKYVYHLKMQAAGAKRVLGLGVQFPDNLQLKPGSTVASTGAQAHYESDTNSVMFFGNVHDVVNYTTEFLNTKVGETYYTPVEWDVTIPMVRNSKRAVAVSYRYIPYNFFLTVGNRNKEIHPADYPPTNKADQSLFGTGNDTSNIGSGRYYRNASNLGWVILIDRPISYTIENHSILLAYPQFGNWVNNRSPYDWYKTVDGSHLFP